MGPRLGITSARGGRARVEASILVENGRSKGQRSRSRRNASRGADYGKKGGKKERDARRGGFVMPANGVEGPATSNFYDKANNKAYPGREVI